MRRWLSVTAGLLVAGGVFGLATAAGGGDDPAGPTTAAAPAPAGRAVFARMGCGGCHTLAAANARGEIGPDLDTALAGYDATTLARQIVDPAPTPGFVAMPTDFGERMSAAELSALVTFLLGTVR